MKSVGMGSLGLNRVRDDGLGYSDSNELSSVDFCGLLTGFIKRS